MSRKWTREKVAELVESEGLGYAVTDYLSHEDIEDPGLAKLWAQAEATLGLIDKMLTDASKDGD